MRFNVSSTSLSNRLQAISRVQSSKNALPILDCILFELADGQLKMTASDSETTMVTTVEVTEAEGEGKFAIGAKQLISSVKEISEQLGFANHSFFGKYVKAQVGTSPAEYRKRLRGKSSL